MASSAFCRSAGIIAAVVDDRLAVAIGDADPVRHLVGRDHVAAAHLGRSETEAARHQVDRALHREGGFRTAGAAIGAFGTLLVKAIFPEAARFSIL